MNVHHSTTDQTFRVTLDGHEGELTYAQPRPGLLDFQHTWVDEALRGRGVADALAHAALEYAKAQKLQIRATCPFVSAYIQRHPEWEALYARAS